MTLKDRNKPRNAKVLVCAAPQECFWTNDGQIIADLRELAAALKIMDNELYRYHVTRERNDFADWVEKVLCDAECAAALRGKKTPKTAYTIVTKHLKHYAV